MVRELAASSLTSSITGVSTAPAVSRSCCSNSRYSISIGILLGLLYEDGGRQVHGPLAIKKAQRRLALCFWQG